jgi:uncharacterized BrkB/YihY/UPF0761 family membrane protein
MSSDPDADEPSTDPESLDDLTAARLHGWKYLTSRSSEAVAAGKGRADRWMETHRDRPLIDAGLRMYTRDRECAGTVVGSAIAFRLFLFFVPLLLCLVGIAGFFGSTFDDKDLAANNLTGGIANQINAALQQPTHTRWIAVVLGLFGMATTGRTLSKTLNAASCLAWRLPMKTRASAKVVGAIVGLIAGIGLVAVIVNTMQAKLGIAVTSVSFVPVLGIYLLAWIFVLSLLPRPSSDPGALLPGALLNAVTLVGMQIVSQLYLPGKLSHASQLYGAIGTAVVVLGWFFILGRVTIFSMVINAVIYERFGSITEVVFALPVLRALPRRFPSVRKFFALDEPAGDAGRVDESDVSASD